MFNKSYKKLNILVFVIILSFFSLILVSCRKEVINEHQSFTKLSSSNLQITTSGNYFTASEYFGGSEVTVDIGRYNPSINDEKKDVTLLYNDIVDIINRVDAYSDNFRENNDNLHGIYYINNHVNEKIEIHKELYTLLEKSIYIKKETNGFFDINIGKIIDGWKDIIESGAASETDLNNKIAQIKSIEVNNDVDAVKLEEENNKYYVTIKENVKLDLGGIAKGYVVDLISEYLIDKGISDYRIKGSDSSLKYGSQKYDSKGKISDGYKIIIENVFLNIPWFDDDNIIEYRYGMLDIKNTAVTTSGDTVQNKTVFGRKVHHIISPLTKEPLTHNRILTIVHPDATLSDAMSTALFSMNDSERELFLESDFALDNNLSEFIIFKTNKQVVENFNKTNYEHNDKTWDYPKYDPDEEPGVNEPNIPPFNEGDDALKKTTRDFIIISMIIIIATLGFIMFSNAFNKIGSNVSHSLVTYNNREDLVRVDFKKNIVIKLAEQSDASGYPIIDEVNSTITVLGYEQSGSRYEVVIKYSFDRKSMQIIDETSPNKVCTKDGEQTAKSITCIPNRISIKFVADKDKGNDIDGNV